LTVSVRRLRRKGSDRRSQVYLQTLTIKTREMM
jgi:hypothetical protein